MKKLLTLLFAAALSTVAMAQTTVTFTVMVDVTDYVAGGATIAANGLRVGGTFGALGAVVASLVGAKGEFIAKMLQSILGVHFANWQVAYIVGGCMGLILLLLRVTFSIALPGPLRSLARSIPRSLALALTLGISFAPEHISQLAP